MTKDEADDLIDRIPYITTLAALTEKARLSFYQKAVARGEPLDLVKTVKTCWIRQGMASGKNMSEQEKQKGDTARRLLHEQLAEALGIRESEVENYIKTQLENQL